MDYETALALKEAGFPQTLKFLYYPDRKSPLRNSLGKILLTQETVVVPTLEELISACGDEIMLTNECGDWEAWKGSTSEMVRMGESGAKYEATGSTPTIAMAKLWLSLNKK